PADGFPVNDTTSTVIHSIPTITTFPYAQNFENGSGGWLASGVNSSWKLGTPAKFTINSAASGNNSWITGLSASYNNDEASAVTGPCFNFSTLAQPLLTMKIWWESEDGYDGAVLQSSVDGGLTWQKVGAFGDPDNWYNHNNIATGPGGQSSQAQGWSGSNDNVPQSGSGGWVTAKHLLTGLGGQPNVKLRIAFSADNFWSMDGFAFDDVTIYENPANDVGVVAASAPVSSTCGAGTQETVAITIKNYGAATQTSIPVSYQVNNNTVVTETFTGSLATNATASYTFTTKADLSAGGTFIIKTATVLPADTFTLNNSFTDTISIFNPIAAFPHFENFENSTTGEPGTLPGGWKMKTGPGIWYPYQWQVHQGPSPFMNTGPDTDHTIGNASGIYLLAEGVKGNPGDTTELITPCFDLSNLTTPGFSFWYHMAGSQMGRLEIEVSANNGATWTKLFELNGPQQMLESDPWRKKVVSLAGYSGNVKLKFKARHGNGAESDIALDDLKVFNIPPVDLELATLQLPASGCGLSATETICVNVLNNSTTAQSNFPVSYQVNGSATVTETFTGTLAPGATAQYCFSTKANLSAANAYSVTVTVNQPADGDATNNTLTGTVNHQPVIATFPYNQDFENGNGGWIMGGTNATWALATPAKTVINSAASGTKAWVTNPTGLYNNFENSYVLSPCFNFSALTGDPDIEMKAWWNADNSRDGAVLQTSIDGGLTWQNVGDFGDNP
ncbi:MAG TPA: hypothetical protein VK927_09045, partial [Adhaeribacter sp.]|nr:hypothetical protein [Adhaeribacter sp.]